ncbi:ankyrin repeat domain-containing protein [Paenibacillus thailandensis]|uniref:Ankyrin repeat domain-containing protein n=1 Tax=Paenibacillus thailandensis TaxID=393250 RepID=A0ABW5QYS4_9BACL
MEIAPQIVNELFEAAKAGDASRLQQLLDDRPELANAENGDGLTLLGYAAHYGHADAVRTILDQGADVNAVSRSKISFIPSNTALHAAIAGERDEAVIRLLLERGARADLFDSNGHTCLHSAAYHDDSEELIRLLVARGADVNAKAEGGDSALSLAVAKGNAKAANALRELGAQL